MSLLFDTTDWYLQTSREFGESIAFISGAEGVLFFANDKTHQKLTVPYTYLSAGLAKGVVFNIAESLTTDPSGGITNVQMSGGQTFGIQTFPCMGVAWMIGATAGIFQPSFMSHSGISALTVQFGLGLLPRGKVALWGRFNSILPSVGPSLGLFSFTSARMDALN
jgi:hypothetical protein